MRDDIEAIGYLLVYLIKGNLPWFDLDGDYIELKKKVFDLKVSISTDELCRNLPELKSFIDYSRQLWMIKYQIITI